MINRYLKQERLNELFEYRDGSLYNKTNRSSNSRKGNRIGTLSEQTVYERISLDYKMYYSHRLIWIMHNGDIPECLFIDHIDGDKTNNRIENLRVVTRQENGFNTKAKGYAWNKQIQKYTAQIHVNGKKKHLGIFDLEEDAHQAYQVAKKKYHIIENRWK